MDEAANIRLPITNSSLYAGLHLLVKDSLWGSLSIDFLPFFKYVDSGEL